MDLILLQQAEWINVSLRYYQYTSTQTIYVYAETGTSANCFTENSFTVTINDTPLADAPADVTIV